MYVHVNSTFFFMVNAYSDFGMLTPLGISPKQFGSSQEAKRVLQKGTQAPSGLPRSGQVFRDESSMQ